MTPYHSIGAGPLRGREATALCMPALRMRPAVVPSICTGAGRNQRADKKARREPGIPLSMPLATISRKHVCMILSSDSVNAVAKSLHITFPLRRIARLDRQVVDYDPLDDRLGQCGDLCP